MKRNDYLKIKPKRKNPTPEKEKDFLFTMRLPAILHKKVQSNLKKRIGLSRNAWILEAIQEKLEGL